MKKPVPRVLRPPYIGQMSHHMQQASTQSPVGADGRLVGAATTLVRVLAIDPAVLPTLSGNEGSAREVNPSEIKDLIAKLEVPFPTSVIESRVSNTTKDSLPRGQVTLYADQRTFTDLEHQMVDQHKAIDLVSPQELRSIFPAPFSPTRPRFGK